MAGETFRQSVSFEYREGQGKLMVQNQKQAADHQAGRENRARVVVSLLLGLGAGAGGALLFAPDSGQKTRAGLARAIEERLQSGRKTIEPALKRVQTEFETLRQEVDLRLGKIRQADRPVLRGNKPASR